MIKLIGRNSAFNRYVLNSRNKVRKFIGIGLMAEASSIDPIGGMVATNVQEALEELATATPGTAPEYNRSLLLMGG